MQKGGGEELVRTSHISPVHLRNPVYRVQGDEYAQTYQTKINEVLQNYVDAAK